MSKNRKFFDFLGEKLAKCVIFAEKVEIWAIFSLKPAFFDALVNLVDRVQFYSSIILGTLIYHIILSVLYVYTRSEQRLIVFLEDKGWK